MKERPILFSAQMVKAILEGRKSMTRRVVTTHNSICSSENVKNLNFSSPNIFKDRLGGGDAYLHIPHNEDGTTHRVWPRWSTGDRLWVRETCLITRIGDDDGGPLCEPIVIYKADGGYPEDWQSGYIQRPSIFMPRWASRITLEITGVRVERLQEITTRDAIREGYPVTRLPELSDEEKDIIRQCGAPDLALSSHPAMQHLKITPPHEWFEKLWDSINGKKHPWSSDPRVWVIEFKKL